MKKLSLFLFACLCMAACFSQPLGWSNSKVINVQENSGISSSNYQLKVTLDTQTPIGLGFMNSNGDDIRFGTDCNTANLNYWIESGINTPNTIIWVKIDTLQANDLKHIYLFYNNPSATAISSIPSTFFGQQSCTDSVNNTNLSSAGDCQRGFRFAPTQDVLVTAFGRFEPNGIARYITLFDVATQAIIQQSIIGGPANQFTYADLTTPIWLTQGTQYLLEMFTPNGSNYYFGAAPQMGQHMIYYDMRYCNGCTQNTYPLNSLGGMHYGYPDFWYYTRTQLPVTPTYTITDVETGFLGADDAYCVSHVLDAGYPGGTFLWNDSSATQTYNVTNTGTYFVNGTSVNGCLFADTVIVTINSSPVVNLGADTLVCNTTIVLDAQNPSAVSYNWSTGDATQTIITGVTNDYFVEVTDTNGCVNADTVHVTNATLPVIIANIAPDTACYGDSVLFNATGGISYVWSDGFGNGSRPVFISQSYSVTGTDANGCTNTAATEIEVLHLPLVSFNSPENVACLSYGPIALSGGSPAGGVYTGPGIAGNDFLPSTGAGTYLLSYTFTDGQGCSATATDDITVLECLGKEENAGSVFHIYPNPSYGEFIIHVETLDPDHTLKIYNMLGEVVYEKQLQTTQQTLQTGLPPGTYVLQLINAQTITKRTIIIQ